MKYQEIEGDLIKLAKEGKFDVIAHGCNCFCTMKRGIAVEMAKTFFCDQFKFEHKNHKGNINKLGQIDYSDVYVHEDGDVGMGLDEGNLIVVNCYTQYEWSTKDKPFDYEAFTLCMRKMNHVFKSKHIGLPQIGAGLAGGDWNLIKSIIQKELKDCTVTVVIYKS